MKKLIIILLLGINCAYAQTSIPGSGAVSIYQIATVMYNIGEISPPAYALGNFTLSALNANSHLTDNTAPFSISDWYGYGPDGSGLLTKGVPSGATCFFTATDSPANAYWASGPTPSSPLYSDSGKTTFLPAGFYKWYNSYITVGASGVITDAYNCAP